MYPSAPRPTGDHKGRPYLRENQRMSSKQYFDEVAGQREVSMQGIGSECRADSECGTEQAKVSIFIASGVKG
jgi:hypothetical protein